MHPSIDIFNIHKKIMDDYRHFVSSFIHISDERIRQKVEAEISRGKFWPEPLIQFNPSFALGESIQNLCAQNILHKDISAIFKGYELYQERFSYHLCKIHGPGRPGGTVPDKRNPAGYYWKR